MSSDESDDRKKRRHKGSKKHKREKRSHKHRHDSSSEDDTAPLEKELRERALESLRKKKKGY
jgi:hypothetical protein